MKRILFIVSLLAILGSCATSNDAPNMGELTGLNLRWYRAGASESETERDRQQCKYEATQITAPLLGTEQPSLTAQKFGMIFINCMRVKGYQVVE